MTGVDILIVALTIPPTLMAVLQIKDRFKKR
ncbi:hypothetical protein ABIA16_002540 [Sinorhizobium fredii]